MANNGFGSLLDLSGEYEDPSDEKSEPNFETDSEKIYHDFERVGDYIDKSFKESVSKDQLSMEFEGSETKNHKSLTF